MKEVLNIAGPIALIIFIISVLAAGVTYWLALNVSTGREHIRKLKTALERDPTASDIAEAMRLWPSARTLPEKMQQSELRKLAASDEMKRAARFESGKALSRFFLIIAFFALAIYITTRVWHPA